ncbi:YhcH/YjgK/YiaL family protein [uncultured Prevotella sp.]|uniref:YhcH/YjgK/YiaL family protein n=1 Tax=uncultured Prevotella sp. TaxID=159272 RepID=UPI0027E38BBC|nr:YhcH/YjgK/YiaL family protein [uncultured Prevotella sp.]
MNRLQTMLAALAISFAASLTTMAQGVYTKPCNDKKLEKKATKWAEAGKWRNGFNAASPDATVNLPEFYTQYKKNPQWKQLFAWLAKTDLLALPAGQHPIPGTTMKANVEDGENGDLEKRGTESHRQYVDFQYVVKGSERFGLLDHITSKPKGPYRPDIINYTYKVDKTKFVDSEPDKFFIFFPGDWHIAKIKTDKEDQNIRVVVVKVEYKE